MYNLAQKLIKNPNCNLGFIDGWGDTPLIISINMLGDFNYNEEEDDEETEYMTEKQIQELRRKNRERKIIWEKETAKMIYELL